MRVQMFAERNGDWRFRWVAPLLNMTIGAGGAMAGLWLLSSDGSPVLGAAVVGLGCSTLTGGVFGVVCRIWARFLHDRESALKQDLAADLATYLSFSCLGVALLAWGAYGLMTGEIAARFVSGLPPEVNTGVSAALSGCGLLLTLALASAAARKARDYSATW